MLEQVREAFKSIEIPKPDAEEQEILDRLRELSEELKGISEKFKWTGGMDSDTSTFESAHLTEPTMTLGTPESAIETVIRCPLDDPNPPEYCNPIDISDFA